MAFNRRADRILAALAFCFVCACATPQPAPPQPLNAAHPEPSRILKELFRSMEARDWNALCVCIAAPAADGTPVAVVPGGNAPAEPPADAWLPESAVAGLRSFLEAPWKQIHFGNARKLRNEPLVIALPVRVVYDYQRVPEAERWMLLGAESARAGRILDWEAVSGAMRQREKVEASGLVQPHEIAFARVQGRWCLWVGPVAP